MSTDKVGRMHPQMHAQVEWSEDHGTINVEGGHCTLRTLPDALVLALEAPDAGTLQLIQERLADRLVQIGKRDGLTVHWTPRQEREDE